MSQRKALSANREHRRIMRKTWFAGFGCSRFLFARNLDLCADGLLDVLEAGVDRVVKGFAVATWPNLFQPLPSFRDQPVSLFAFSETGRAAVMNIDVLGDAQLVSGAEQTQTHIYVNQIAREVGCIQKTDLLEGGKRHEGAEPGQDRNLRIEVLCKLLGQGRHLLGSARHGHVVCGRN